MACAWPSQRALLALVAIGLGWLNRFNDEAEPADEPSTTTMTDDHVSSTTTPTLPEDQAQTTTTVSGPGLPAPMGATVGPGSWSVAGSFDPGVALEDVERIADQVRSWPGVLAVTTVSGGPNAWNMVGIGGSGSPGDESPTACGITRCGPGVVASVAAETMDDVAARLESEFGMLSVTPLDIPADYSATYLRAALELASPADLRFDPAPLGAELPLLTTDVSPSAQTCSSCDVFVETRSGEFWGTDRIRVGLDIADSPALGHTVEFEISRADRVAGLLVDSSGRGGVLTDLRGAFAGRRVYAFAGLPLQAAILAFELADGTAVWQRPLAGMALIVDAPNTADQSLPEGQGPTPNPFRVLDGDGREIITIMDTVDGPIVQDHRVDTGAIGASGLSQEEPMVVDGVTETVQLDGVVRPRNDALAHTGQGIWVATETVQTSSPQRPNESTLVRVDAGSLEVSDRIPLQGMITDLVPAEGELWVVLTEPHKVLRIDAETRTVTHTIDIASSANRVAWDATLEGDHLWIGVDDAFMRIDRDDASVEILPGLSGQWLGEADGWFWFYGPSGGNHTLTRSDTATGEAQDFEVNSTDSPIGTAFIAGDSIWIVYAYPGNAPPDLQNVEAVRFDLFSLEVTDRLDLGPAPAGGAVLADGALWTMKDDALARIDTVTAEAVDVTTVSPGTHVLAATTDSVWLANTALEVTRLTRVDVSTGEVTADIRVDQSFEDFLMVDDAVWGVGGDGSVTRIEVPE